MIAQAVSWWVWQIGQTGCCPNATALKLADFEIALTAMLEKKLSQLNDRRRFFTVIAGVGDPALQIPLHKAGLIGEPPKPLAMFCYADGRVDVATSLKPQGGYQLEPLTGPGSADFEIVEVA